ncbi:hypothetical protein BH10BAC4_BH10BAC4_22980 [soil metagenome]
MLRITLILLLIFFTISEFTQAQSAVIKSDNKNKAVSNMPDKTVNEKLVADLTRRIPETRNAVVTWNTADYGYLALYTIDNISRMTLYDGSGRYIETFSRSSWDDRVPEIVKLEFNNSPYNTYDVINFWEGSGSRTHYYLEMQNRSDGTSKDVWVDENGKFSVTPL